MMHLRSLEYCLGVFYVLLMVLLNYPNIFINKKMNESNMIGKKIISWNERENQVLVSLHSSYEIFNEAALQSCGWRNGGPLVVPNPSASTLWRVPPPSLACGWTAHWGFVLSQRRDLLQ